MVVIAQGAKGWRRTRYVVHNIDATLRDYCVGWKCFSPSSHRNYVQHCRCALQSPKEKSCFTLQSPYRHPFGKLRTLTQPCDRLRMSFGKLRTPTQPCDRLRMPTQPFGKLRTPTQPFGKLRTPFDRLRVHSDRGISNKFLTFSY
jgi:hypothetical protein